MKWAVRTFVGATVPFMLAWIYVTELAGGMRRAFREARQEAIISVDDVRSFWRIYDGTPESARRWKERHE